MTTCNAQAYNRCENFNPTLLLREVTSIFGYFKITDTISIHTSLTGSDALQIAGAFGIKPFQSTLPSREVTSRYSGIHSQILFQSTLPSREVTYVYNRKQLHHFISIHTSLTGSDHFWNYGFNQLRNFNPHFPHGK